MRSILHRYILLELLKAFFLSTAGLTLFLAVASALSKLRDRGLGPLDSLELVLYILPVMLVFSMPVSALLTTTLVYGRLSAENEITACRASGLSMSTLLWPVLVLGLIVGALDLLMLDRVIPWARYQAEAVGTQHLERIFFHRMQMRGEESYRDSRGSSYLIKAKHVSGNMLYGVVVAYSSPLTAKSDKVVAIAPAAYVKFDPPAPAGRDFESLLPDTDPRSPPPPPPAPFGDTPANAGPAPDPGAAKPRPVTKEDIAKLFPDDATPVRRGQIFMKLFGVYATNASRESSGLGDPSFTRSLVDTRVRKPDEMTISQLRRRYAAPQNTFDHQWIASLGPAPEKLAEYRTMIKAAALSQMQSRYASVVSCILLVGLGAAMGIFFRHGHLLTAFFVSMGPSLFAIFSILLGTKMVETQPENMHSLVGVIWLGNIVVALLDAFVIAKLLRS